jgi:hypothetical protein
MECRIVRARDLESTDIDARSRQPLLEQIDVAFLASWVAIAIVDEKNAHGVE